MEKKIGESIILLHLDFILTIDYFVPTRRLCVNISLLEVYFVNIRRSRRLCVNIRLREDYV